MLDVSKRVKTGLEAAGYTVILARTDNTTQVTFRQRADAAKSAGAVMGISIHTAPDNINDAWPQRVGSYREYQGSEQHLKIKRPPKRARPMQQPLPKPALQPRATLFQTTPIPHTSRLPLGARIFSQKEIFPLLNFLPIRCRGYITK